MSHPTDVSTHEPARTTGSNIFNDYGLLVVPLQGAAVFPNRCVVTGQETTNRFRFRERIAPRHHEAYRQGAQYAHAALKGAALAGAAAIAAPVAVVGAVALLATMKTLEFEIGLAESLATRHRRGHRVGLIMVFGGLAVMLLLPIGVVAAVSSLFPQMQSNDVFTCAVPVIVIGALTAIAGLIYFGLNVRQPMTLERIDGQYAWFKGAHHDFVSALPPFPTPTADEICGRMPG